MAGSGKYGVLRHLEWEAGFLRWNWKPAVRLSYLEARDSGFVQTKLAASSVLPLPFQRAIWG